MQDRNDYAATPDALPDHSDIRKALALGARFEWDEVEGLWFAKHPMRVTCGESQIDAAKEFVK